MGKKANIITLRKQKLNETSNLQKFLIKDNFIKTLKRCFDKKGTIVTYYSTSSASNTAIINVKTFYTTAKVNFLKKKRILKETKAKTLLKNLSKNNSYTKRSFFARKTKQSSKKKRKKKKISKTILWKKAKNANKKAIKIYSDFNKLFKDFFNPQTKVLLVINIINKKENRALKSALNTKLKKFKGALFSRRLNLYYDCIKLCSLFATRKITAEVFCNILGTIFKFLQKKSHGKFLAFVQIIIDTLIKPSKFSDSEQIPTAISGIKMRMNGKLKGKLRASSFSWSAGKISQQTITADADYSLTHIKTVYGCFGLKVWVNYKSDNSSENIKKSKIKKSLFKKLKSKSKNNNVKISRVNFKKLLLKNSVKSIKGKNVSSINIKEKNKLQIDKESQININKINENNKATKNIDMKKKVKETVENKNKNSTRTSVNSFKTSISAQTSSISSVINAKSKDTKSNKIKNAKNNNDDKASNNIENSKENANIKTNITKVKKAFKQKETAKNSTKE